MSAFSTSAPIPCSIASWERAHSAATTASVAARPSASDVSQPSDDLLRLRKIKAHITATQPARCVARQDGRWRITSKIARRSPRLPALCTASIARCASSDAALSLLPDAMCAAAEGRRTDERCVSNTPSRRQFRFSKLCRRHATDALMTQTQSACQRHCTRMLKHVRAAPAVHSLAATHLERRLCVRCRRRGFFSRRGDSRSVGPSARFHAHA
jgi:hypothetical protein